MSKLSIDFGNTNMKAATKDKKNEVVTAVVRSLATKDSMDHNYVVTYDGETVYFGTGDTLVENDKVDRKYLEHSILLFAHILGLQGNLELGVGLPLIDYKSESKEILEGRIGRIKDIAGEVNGNKLSVTVTRSKVMAEGHAAYVSCMDAIKVTPSLLLDVGYRTLDVIGLKKEGGKLKLDKYMTVQKGLLNIYEDIARALPRSVKLDREGVENALENNSIVLTQDKEVDIIDYIGSSQDTVDSMMKEIKLKFPDFENRMIYLVGGGAGIISPLIRNKNKEIIGDQEKCLFANAVGYLFQMK